MMKQGDASHMASPFLSRNYGSEGNTRGAGRNLVLADGCGGRGPGLGQGTGKIMPTAGRGVQRNG